MHRAIVLAALLVAAPPLARACDPEAMEAEITAICRAAVDPAAAIARAALPQATADEARAIAAAILAAGDACDVGDPVAGARQAVEIARLAGRIEARGARPASTL
ncbi:hypothetical protein [Roseomonas sp. AR75]|uniref:hypothetical protein n=1 Tax=Roseomonas sp. AR75 TaxID=2562311 RepID=UPI0010C0C828|nr:hypothetical protein [Roseomonas sp. AR75]